MALKRFCKILQRLSAPRKKKLAGAPLFCFAKMVIRRALPGDMIDTHSLKWPQDGFGPAAFKDIDPSFWTGIRKLHR